MDANNYSAEQGVDRSSLHLLDSKSVHLVSAKVSWNLAWIHLDRQHDAATHFPKPSSWSVIPGWLYFATV